MNKIVDIHKFIEKLIVAEPRSFDLSGEVQDFSNLPIPINSNHSKCFSGQLSNFSQEIFWFRFLFGQFVSKSITEVFTFSINFDKEKIVDFISMERIKIDTDWSWFIKIPPIPDGIERSSTLLLDWITYFSHWMEFPTNWTESVNCLYIQILANGKNSERFS